MTALRAPGVNVQADVCHCGHPFDDHIRPETACDVPLCECPEFESDEPERDVDPGDWWLV